ncbi:MAG: GNAT family N-acetyltransferase [Candidatus Beckwithbacteria bacterium]
MNLFQTAEYLQIFTRHFCQEKDIVEEVWEKYQGGLILLGMKPVLNGQEVSDYAKTDIKDLPKGFKTIQLDYVREDCQTFNSLRGDSLKVEKQEVAPFINLPKTFEEYLTSLKRKYRKEIKRKIKRLEEVKYEAVKEDNLAEFIRLHRLSDPAKDKFMSEQMADFFKDMFEAKIPGWEQRLDFLKIEGKYAAGILSFVNETEWWLYNSGFDPAYSYFSAGVNLKALSIKQAIETGKTKYDFLRGNERYKYELGAKDLQLYKLLLKKVI